MTNTATLIAMITECLWCGVTFERRSTGGKAQRFCSQACRRDFDAGCRAYVASEVRAGRLPIDEVRMALGQRARCSEADQALGRCSAAPNNASGYSVPVTGVHAAPHMRAE